MFESFSTLTYTMLMDDNHTKNLLDVRGLLCPLPVLKARKALASMVSGEVLELHATDPMSAIDVPHFCSEQGHRLLSQEQHDNIYIYRIQRP